MPTLAIHIKTRKGGLQIKEPCIVLTYYKDTGGMFRALRTRGVNETFIASRECSGEEMETESHKWRMDFITYKDWDKLIDDEKEFTDDKNWFDILAELKNKHPQFKTQEVVV